MSEIARKVEVYTDAGGNYRVRVTKNQPAHRAAESPTPKVAGQSQTARSAPVHRA
jgi:hypothetical protein